MKELTIEEKAKCYNEAIERAKKIHKYSSDLAEIKRIEQIFPELKESEDEKIRKTLIHIVKGACDKYGIKYQGKEINEEKLIAWLENQGEKIIPKDVDKAALQYVDTCPVNGEITHDNITEPYWNNHSMINAYKAGWLEKQGEQKSADLPNGEDF